MEYKEYTITAEVKAYQEWALTEDGDPSYKLQDFDGIDLDRSDITSYRVYSPDEEVLGDFESLESAKKFIDDEAK